MICLVCLKAGVKSDEIVATFCGHCYHRSCIEKWFEKSLLCPSCRRPSSKSTLIKLYIDFSEENNFQDVEDLNEKVYLQEKEINELKMKSKISESDMNTLRRKLLKTQSAVEILRCELQSEKTLSAMSQRRLKELKLKYKMLTVSKEPVISLEPNAQQHKPYICQQPDPYQPSCAYETLNSHQSSSGQHTLSTQQASHHNTSSVYNEPSSSYQPTIPYPSQNQLPNFHQPSQCRQASSNDFDFNFRYPSSFQPFNYNAPPSSLPTPQSTISFQPATSHAYQPSFSSPCFKCSGKGYLEMSPSAPFNSSSLQHCFVCMGKRFL